MAKYSKQDHLMPYFAGVLVGIVLLGIVLLIATDFFSFFCQEGSDNCNAFDRAQLILGLLGTLVATSAAVAVILQLQQLKSDANDREQHFVKSEQNQRFQKAAELCGSAEPIAIIAGVKMLDTLTRENPKNFYKISLQLLVEIVQKPVEQTLDTAIRTNALFTLGRLRFMRRQGDFEAICPGLDDPDVFLENIKIVELVFKSGARRMDFSGLQFIDCKLDSEIEFTTCYFDNASLIFSTSGNVEISESSLRHTTLKIGHNQCFQRGITISKSDFTTAKVYHPGLNQKIPMFVVSECVVEKAQFFVDRENPKLRECWYFDHKPTGLFENQFEHIFRVSTQSIPHAENALGVPLYIRARSLS